MKSDKNNKYIYNNIKILNLLIIEFSKKTVKISTMKTTKH